MANPLVSVVIPCYNHEKYVKIAIESVLNQDYDNIELIVVNDGSIDNSHSAIEALQKEHNFKYIVQENKGVSVTSNKGLFLSNGEYFCLLASDDYYYTNKISKEVEFLQNHKEFAMVYSDFCFVDEDGVESSNKPCKNCVSGDIFQALLKNCFIAAHTVMLKTSIIKDLGGFDEKLKHEDYPMWLKIAQKYKIGYVQEVLCAYRKHGANATKNIPLAVEKTHATLSRYKDEPVVQKRLKESYLLWFCQLSKTANKDMAKKYMRLAFAHHWYNPKFWNSVRRTFLS